MTRSAAFIDYENIALQVERILREERSRFYTAGDCAEATLRLIERSLEKVEERFDLSVIRAMAFADWEALATHKAQHGLTLLHIRPVYALGKRGRSNVEIQLSLEAQRTLLTRPDIDAFAVMSGDRSSIPIVSELLDAGREVVVASMRGSVSGDLVKITGEARFLELEELFEIPAGTPRAADPRMRNGEPGETADEHDTPTPAEPVHLDQAHQERFLDLARAASERYPRGVWLGPFLKNYMNEEFSELTNDQRKELVDLVHRLGRVRIRYVEDGGSLNGGYSVLELADDPAPPAPDAVS